MNTYVCTCEYTYVFMYVYTCIMYIRVHVSRMFCITYVYTCIMYLVPWYPCIHVCVDRQWSKCACTSHRTPPLNIKYSKMGFEEKVELHLVP